MTRIALIADGRLLLTDTNGTTKRHDCTFASEMESRQQRSAEKNAWKKADSGAVGMFSRSSLWNQSDESAVLPRPRIVSVCGGLNPNSMVYSLWTGVVGAFLNYDFEESYEQRVFHRERFHAAEFQRDPRTGRLVCRHGDGEISNLALLDPDGRNLVTFTEGDSIDGSPSWDPSSPDTVVYHSAGISRDQHGYAHGFSNFTIERVNMKTGEIETLLNEPESDLLCPQFSSAGELYFIRRPYHGPGGKRPSAWVTLKDTLLFPFRLVRAIIDFAHIFSQLVSKKPLTTSGGPKAKGPEPVRMWIHGRMIDAEKVASEGGPEGSFAPADWRLIKRSANGSETEIAKHVLAYDLSSDGKLLFTDGRSTYLLENGNKKKISSEPMTDSVKWIEPGKNWEE